MAVAPEGALYLHYPCFDGLISAAIAWDFLERSRGWSPAAICPINYSPELRSAWLATPMPADSAIVDFLYHPGARFWVDHHATTFLTEGARLDYERGGEERFLLYDPAFTSCAKLLWDCVGSASPDAQRYAEMAYWADRTDSATYDSVDEAILGSQPALQIARSLSAGRDDAYCAFLLQHLRTDTLAQVAALPEVASREREVFERIQRGLDLIMRGDTVALEDGAIAVLDIHNVPNASISRYSPYRRYPNARYSVALTRADEESRILAMRNPWLDFESVPLGKMFERLSESFPGIQGGGHQRVGAVVIPADSPYEPNAVLRKIVNEIRAQDRALSPARAAS